MKTFYLLVIYFVLCSIEYDVRSFYHLRFLKSLNNKISGPSKYFHGVPNRVLLLILCIRSQKYRGDLSPRQK